MLCSQLNSVVELYHGLNNELQQYINNMMMMMLFEVPFLIEQCPNLWLRQHK